MESTTFVDGVLLPDDGRQVEAQSLYETLAKNKDGRKRRGRRYQVALVLTLVVLAKMAGETSLSGIADWARLRIEGLRSAPTHSIPSQPGASGSWIKAATTC